MSASRTWKNLLYFSLFVIFCTLVHSSTIEVAECPPPDYPQWGDYGPKQDYYLAGDVIHYYCDVETYIGGNYLRICQDTGDWTGDTPVCDQPMDFAIVNQSSTAEPSYENEAENANDGIRTTCSSTRGQRGSTWMATFAQPCHLLRVMLFLPKGEAAYEVMSLKADGSEYSCGRARRRIDRHEWVFHNCLEPNNTGIVAVKIRSLSRVPLQLCEVVTHALTDPTCVDPHVQVENGRIILNRKSAVLVCDSGYRRGQNTKINCVRTGVWERKDLYCIETDREVDVPDPGPKREQPIGP